jgi:hypothetical protein
MKIHFVRSGGFGGAATRVEGDVTFDGHGAQVISEKSGYQRPLAASEAEMLRCAAQPKPKSIAGSEAKAVADAWNQVGVKIKKA